MSSQSAEDLNAAIAAKGEQIRSLKAAKPPSIKEDLLPLVEELNALKIAFKDITGEDFGGKPPSEPKKEKAGKKDKAPAAAAAAGPSQEVKTAPVIDISADLPYGFGALAANLPDRSNRKFYLTTAIAYMNGYPHIGHAYEFITSDVIVRFHRVFGYDTFFLTGADEHGQKVAQSAEKAGLAPIEHCNIYANAFKALNERLCVSHSRYIRTTEAVHKQTAQKLWTICADAGDIYLDCYEGWYNEREEAFVNDSEAEALKFVDPGSGLPLKRVKEESYFFRMSRYQEQLIDHIEKNESFIEPSQYRNHTLSRLRGEPLKDLSVSRTSFTWGIPVPDGFDPSHVMYVWFDALSNYLSGVSALDAGAELKDFWPAGKHIIGKDIIWFHCVIWPCILMSAKVALPANVYCHGFVNAADGRKMSKSYGNTIDPVDILSRHQIDTIRYYLCAATTYGTDLNFSEPAMIASHNSELADIVGNLVNRALNLCKKYSGGKIPDTTHDSVYSCPFNAKVLIEESEQLLRSSNLSVLLFKAMEAARATNRFLTEAEPWKLKGADEARREPIVRTTLEAIYIFMHFLAPVTPIAAAKTFKKLNTQPVVVHNLRGDFYNLTPGVEIDIGDILFSKIII